MRRTHWLWALLLFSHMGCNGCKKYEIAYEEDLWGAAVAIDSVNSPGSINGYPVLEQRGTISKNVPGVGTPFLCALMVPDGETPDAGATAIQGHTVTKNAQDASSSALSLGRLHKLPGGSFVQYERPLDADETGSVDFSVASWDSDNSLALGTTYNIYLGIKVGPHFFYSECDSVGHTLPDTASLTQITMDSAQCNHDRDGSGKVLPIFSASAAVTSLPSSGNAGFLFLKQGASLTPAGVLAKQLQAGSMPFSTTQDTLIAHPDSGVVICATAIKETFGITNVEDTAGVLEKGATYDVYGYVEDGNNYFVSQNSRAVILPAVEVQIVMESVGEPSLIAMKNAGSAEYNVPEFSLEATGSIKKIDNAKDPVAGFVFVKDGQATDKENICQAITDSISNTCAGGEVIAVNEAKDHVVCIAKTTDVNAERISCICDLKDANRSRLDLTQDYQVYCWVKDAKGDGELFLSDNSQELKVFYVEGDGITSVLASHEGNALTLKPQLDTHLRNKNHAEMAFVFLEDNQTLVENNLKELRTQYDTIDTARANGYNTGPLWKSSLLGTSDKCCYYISGSNVTTTEEQIQAINATDLTPDTKYTLSLVVRQGDVLYSIPSSPTYTSPAYVNYTSSNPTVTLPEGQEIELDISEAKAYYVYSHGKRVIKTVKVREKELVQLAIDKYYGNSSDQSSAYEKFGVQ